MSIYKACDIRGRFGLDLQVEHAARLGAALVAMNRPTKILVGGDGRVSTPVLKAALIDSLLHHGCQVFDLGLAPTPLFYFARRRLGIETGVMVTASHNPAGDNGFKVTLGPLPITPEEMLKLAELMEYTDIPPHLLTTTPPERKGELITLDLIPDYLSFLVEHTPNLTGLKVVVDCANGMAGLVARQVWEKTRAEVTFLLERVDGRFPIHPPNPAEVQNLSLLQQAVVQAGADLGVAYDGDADRVAFVDEKGQVVVNDKVIVLFVRHALHDGPQTVVFDQKCSRIVPDTIRQLGGTPVMELSGHTFIKRAFMTLGAAYAGELSGHHFLRPLEGDDGFGASLVFASIVKESRKSLSGLAEGIPSYPITPDIRLPMDPAAIPALLASLEERLGQEARIVKTDGLRLEFADGWGLVRPSVTEPVVTMRFEGVDQAALRRMLSAVENASPSLLGKLTAIVPG